MRTIDRLIDWAMNRYRGMPCALLKDSPRESWNKRHKKQVQTVYRSRHTVKKAGVSLFRHLTVELKSFWTGGTSPTISCDVPLATESAAPSASLHPYLAASLSPTSSPLFASGVACNSNTDFAHSRASPATGVCSPSGRSPSRIFP